MGTGIKQLRENIAESKLSYEIMDDAAQAFLKSKIMDNIHKYYYLIVFASYILDQVRSFLVLYHFHFQTFQINYLKLPENLKLKPSYKNLDKSCSFRQQLN